MNQYGSLQTLCNFSKWFFNIFQRLCLCRYALICKKCSSHNGMALREEFEFLAFQCCYCFHFNPARKQRPSPPPPPPAPSLSAANSTTSLNEISRCKSQAKTASPQKVLPEPTKPASPKDLSVVQVIDSSEDEAIWFYFQSSFDPTKIGRVKSPSFEWMKTDKWCTQRAGLSAYKTRPSDANEENSNELWRSKSPSVDNICRYTKRLTGHCGVTQLDKNCQTFKCLNNDLKIEAFSQTRMNPPKLSFMALCVDTFLHILLWFHN